MLPRPLATWLDDLAVGAVARLHIVLAGQPIDRVFAERRMELSWVLTAATSACGPTDRVELGGLAFVMFHQLAVLRSSVGRLSFLPSFPRPPGLYSTLRDVI